MAARLAVIKLTVNGFVVSILPYRLGFHSLQAIFHYDLASFPKPTPAPGYYTVV